MKLCTYFFHRVSERLLHLSKLVETVYENCMIYKCVLEPEKSNAVHIELKSGSRSTEVIYHNIISKSKLRR